MQDKKIGKEHCKMNMHADAMTGNVKVQTATQRKSSLLAVWLCYMDQES